MQLKIEEDYGKYRENLNLPVVDWLSKVPKSVIKQNFINWDHTKTKSNIKRRQEIINGQLEQAEINLFNHFQKPYPLNCKTDNQNSIDHLLKILYHALAIVLYNSLYYFYINFEQKKILLNFDLHDAYLVKSFYDQNPTEEQIAIVQKIWRMQRKASRKVLHQKKKNNRTGIYSDNGPQKDYLAIASLEIFNRIVRTIIALRQTYMQHRTEYLYQFISTIDYDHFF